MDVGFPSRAHRKRESAGLDGGMRERNSYGGRSPHSAMDIATARGFARLEESAHDIRSDAEWRCCEAQERAVIAV